MRVAVSIVGWDKDEVLINEQYHNYFKLYDIVDTRVVSKQIINLGHSLIPNELVHKYKCDYIMYGDLPNNNNIPEQNHFSCQNEKVQVFYGVYGKADDVIGLFIKTYYLQL